MDFLNNEFLNNDLRLWLGALFLIIAVLLTARILRGVLRRKIAQQSERKSNGIVAFLTSLTVQTKP